MPDDARSFVDVIRDVVSNVEDLVASEVRLARAEVTTEEKKAARAGVVLAVGAILAVCGLELLLFAAAFGLAAVIPVWAAVLAIAGVVSVTATLLVIIGLGRLKQIHPKPDDAIQTAKETAQWLTNQTR